MQNAGNALTNVYAILLRRGMTDTEKASVAVTVGAFMRDGIQWRTGFRSPRFSSHRPLRPLSPSPNASFRVFHLLHP